MSSRDIKVDDIDSTLHHERLLPDGSKRTYTARVADLPIGVMVEHEGHAKLVAPSGLQRWSFGGYSPPEAYALDLSVRVLTPASVVSAFAAGFTPERAMACAVLDSGVRSASG